MEHHPIYERLDWLLHYCFKYCFENCYWLWVLFDFIKFHVSLQDFRIILPGFLFGIAVISFVYVFIVNCFGHALSGGKKYLN